jgi:hypothetical protein
MGEISRHVDRKKRRGMRTGVAGEENDQVCTERFIDPVLINEPPLHFHEIIHHISFIRLTKGEELAANILPCFVVLGADEHDLHDEDTSWIIYRLV